MMMKIREKKTRSNDWQKKESDESKSIHFPEHCALMLAILNGMIFTD